MPKTILFRALLTGLLSVWISPAFAEELNDAEVTRLIELLRPEKDEPWRTIPWKISVLDAQAAAAEQKKPLFIWAMDGHPLGCT